MTTAGLLLCGFTAAQAQIKLVVEAPNEATLLEKPLSEVKRVAFAERSVDFLDQNQQSMGRHALSEIKKIVFSAGTAGIAPVASETTELTLTQRQGVLTLSGPEAALRGAAAIYATDGRLLFLDKNWQGEAIDASALPAGIYLLKVNTKTFKFRKS